MLLAKVLSRERVQAIVMSKLLYSNPSIEQITTCAMDIARDAMFKVFVSMAEIADKKVRGKAAQGTELLLPPKPEDGEDKIVDDTYIQDHTMELVQLTKPESLELYILKCDSEGFMKSNRYHMAIVTMYERVHMEHQRGMVRLFRLLAEINRSDFIHISVFNNRDMDTSLLFNVVEASWGAYRFCLMHYPKGTYEHNRCCERIMLELNRVAAVLMNNNEMI